MLRSALACLAVAGCGSVAVSPRKDADGVRHARASGTDRCAGAVSVGAGARLDAWRMGSVQMLSRTDGIGATAPLLSCYIHERAGEVVVQRPQTVRLAITHDGGVDWTTVAAAVPDDPTGAGRGEAMEHLRAQSGDRAWLLTSTGRVVATTSGGRSWKVAPLVRGAVQVALTRHSLWVLSCSELDVQSFTCRPGLERLDLSTGRWTVVTLPRGISSTPDAQMSAPTDRTVVILLRASGTNPGHVLSTADGGVRWVRRPYPKWNGPRCQSVSNLATAGPRTWWLLCLGPAGAGSSEKALLRTENAGRTWAVISSVDSLTRLPAPGSVPLSEPNSFVAGSASKLWLALENGLAESADGGARWAVVPGVNPQGIPTQFDVRSPEDAWLLAPGAAMWRSKDGSHWSALGPLHTG